MVRSAIADEYLLSYITALSEKNPCSIGLILGQSCLGKDYIVHLAKTPPFQSEDNSKEEIKNIADINEGWVAEHAKQATRMLSGGIYVLGIFLISSEDLFNPPNNKIKCTLQTLHKQLEVNKYIYGNCTKEKLILVYSTKTQKYMCKTYNVETSVFQTADFKFVPKAAKWGKVECYFEIDEVRYLKKNEADWPLQNHMNVILDEIHQKLESAVFLINNELHDDEDTIESIGRKKKDVRGSSKRQDTSDIMGHMKLSIFQTKSSSASNAIDSPKIQETCGKLKVIGQVVSNLWLQPKLSIGEVSKAAREDIMRSLSARLEMHLDSLTEEENSEDFNSVHEPPRRVLISLPNSEITLSDYLFPGEGPQDAKASLEELLDIKISGKLKIQDLEGQADITQYYNSALESDSKEVLPSLPGKTNKFMFIGLITAFIILMLSIFLHIYN